MPESLLLRKKRRIKVFETEYLKKALNSNISNLLSHNRTPLPLARSNLCHFPCILQNENPQVKLKQSRLSISGFNV